jgi:hypothetical protein
VSSFASRMSTRAKKSFESIYRKIVFPLYSKERATKKSYLTLKNYDKPDIKKDEKVEVVYLLRKYSSVTYVNNLSAITRQGQIAPALVSSP